MVVRRKGQEQQAVGRMIHSDSIWGRKEDWCCADNLWWQREDQEWLTGASGSGEIWDRGWDIVDCTGAGRRTRAKGICAEEEPTVVAGIDPGAVIP